MKRIFMAGLTVAAFFSLVAAPVFAGDFLGQNWRVFNVKPDTSSYWDINKPKALSGGIVEFPVQKFLTKTTGSYVVYLHNNYNVALTEDKTITATVSWDPGTYETRSAVHPGAYVRLEFQDTSSGLYDSNDYWWYTVPLDLNSGSGGTITAPLNDRGHWLNQSGKLATDTTTNWRQWQGDIVAMSPYDGFTRAMKNVKEIGLSFGSSGSYASGVAMVGGTGTFKVINFTIE